MFKLIKGYSIVPLDKLNWTITKEIRVKNEKTGKGETKEIPQAQYYSSLSQAWRNMAEQLALESKDFPELTSTLEKLEEIKKAVFKNGKEV